MKVTLEQYEHAARVVLEHPLPMPIQVDPSDLLEVIAELRHLREIETRAKAWSNAEQVLDDLMATPPEQFDCPEEEWEAKQELVYQTRSALRAALEKKT